MIAEHSLTGRTSRQGILRSTNYVRCQRVRFVTSSFVNLVKSFKSSVPLIVEKACPRIKSSLNSPMESYKFMEIS